MTLEQVASAIGRPAPFVWRIEGGKNANPPDPETCRAMWRVLGVSLRSQVEAMGYLDPGEQPAGIAYQITVDDPRAELLAVMEGLVDGDVRILTQALTVIKSYRAKNDAMVQPTTQQTKRSA